MEPKTQPSPTLVSGAQGAPAAFLPPWLTQSEIDDLCHPLRQRSRQAKFLASLLKVNDIPRRPDGLPIVTRTQLERAIGSMSAPTVAVPVGPDWSKIK